MSLHSQGKLVGGNTLTVIQNTDQRCTTTFDIDVDVTRTRIQAVFE